MVRRLTVLAVALVACGEPGVFGRTAQPDSRTVAVPIKDVPVTGNRIKVRLAGGRTLTGELLEALPESITILFTPRCETRSDYEARLCGSGKQVGTVAAADVERIDVVLYSNGAIVGALAAWGAVGTLSTVTHGLVLLYTAPTWALVSILSPLPFAADRGRFATAEGDLGALRVYARFPQGLPPDYKSRARPVRRSGSELSEMETK